MQEQHIAAITVILSPEQALAYAQYLKRVGLDDYMVLASDRTEAYAMQSAGELIRQELRYAGYAPR